MLRFGKIIYENKWKIESWIDKISMKSKSTDTN